MDILIQKMWGMGGYGVFILASVIFVVIGLMGILQQSLIAFKRAKRQIQSKFEN